MSHIETKTLIANKEWILKEKNFKIGTIVKVKKEYSFLKNGEKSVIKNITDFQNQYGIDLENYPAKKLSTNLNFYQIYDYPCSSKPFEPLYNLRKKIPLFSKSSKSKSKYCAGYYLIKFRKGWVKSFCPKLITIERYPYHGPFKSENDIKKILSNLNKNETS